MKKKSERVSGKGHVRPDSFSDFITNPLITMAIAAIAILTMLFSLIEFSQVIP